MPYAKVKTLMLLVLALANVFLLCLVVPLYRESHRQQAAAAAQLEALFARYGVEFDSRALPGDRLLYTLEFSPGGASAGAAMAALLGEGVQPGGGSTRYLSLYQSPQGSCRISRSGSLEASFSGRAPVADPAGDAAALLEAMGVETASLSAAALPDGGQAVTAVQRLLDVPVFSSSLTFTYRGGALERAEGAVFLDTAGLVRTDGTACAAGADALVAFLASRDQLGWVGGAVTGVAQGYLRAETASAAVVRLVPGWRVETDTGAFWVNGVTCQVTPLER